AAAAGGRLRGRHRAKPRRRVAVRFDRRLATRVDPSDIVQESLLEAAARMDEYVRTRPLPFYPWLRRIASDRLADAARRHLHARRPSVGREVPARLPHEAVAELAERLLAPNSAPSAPLRRRERRERVRSALESLPDRDRGVLVLRYLEDLSTSDTALVLGVGEGTVKMRLVRALQRLRDQM